MPQEFDIIAKLFAPLSLNEDAALGLKDDIAFFSKNRLLDGLVITTDTLVEIPIS